jgi:glycosyltransferase involved in cell wall biosynthesis
MKKILIFSYLYPNKKEPMRGIFVSERVKFLKKFYEIKVIAPVPYFPKIRFFKRWNFFAEIPSKEIIDDIEVFHPRFLLFPKRIFRKYIGYWMYLFSKNLLDKIYSQWKFDLIHAHFTIYSGQATNHYCKKRDIPYIITEHYGKLSDDIIYKSIYREIYHKVFTEAKRLILVSKRLENDIRNKLRDLPKIELISNGVDINKFTFVEKKIDKNYPKLISIGNLVVTKGFQYLISAIKILKDRKINCSLTIIGEGKYRKNLEMLIAKFSLQKNVFLAGYVPNEKINFYLEKSDFYVHPSLFESFGVVVIEAMSAGKPVIVTKSGGPEYIVPDEFGIKIDKENSEALAKSIDEMIKNYENYNPKKIRAFVEANFSYENIAKKIGEVYEEILQ